MSYIENKTLKELLENPVLGNLGKEAISKRDLSKEEMYNWTTQEIGEKIGWKDVGYGLERLYEIANKGEFCFKLYSEEECKNYPSRENANIVFFPSDDEASASKPYIFLIPGGGFVNVWNLTEGWPIAKLFNDLGFNVFILTYQVGAEGTAVKAMDDIARAMELIKKREKAFNVNADSYITCGFSAGGYIACLWNTEVGYEAFGLCKPQACFPIYPVTSYRLLEADEWDEGEDKDGFAKFGVGVSMHEACNSCFEIPMHVDGFPKTAIFVANEDDLVNPEHSKMLAKALNEAKIPCRLEVGPTGGHGFADGEGMCMEGWPGRAIEWYEKENAKEALNEV